MWHRKYEPKRVFVGKFSYNSDLIEELNKFCNENNIRTGWISIIGAVKTISLGFYDQEKHEYIYLNHAQISNANSFEITNATGNISQKDGKSFVHLHITVSDHEGKAFGGHVMPGTKIFAGEFMIQELKGEDLHRALDIETRLPLWQE